MLIQNFYHGIWIDFKRALGIELFALINDHSTSCSWRSDTKSGDFPISIKVFFIPIDFGSIMGTFPEMPDRKRFPVHWILVWEKIFLKIKCYLRIGISLTDIRENCYLEIWIQNYLLNLELPSASFKENLWLSHTDNLGTFFPLSCRDKFNKDAEIQF